MEGRIPSKHWGPRVWRITGYVLTRPIQPVIHTATISNFKGGIRSAGIGSQQTHTHSTNVFKGTMSRRPII